MLDLWSFSITITIITTTTTIATTGFMINLGFIY